MSLIKEIEILINRTQISIDQLKKLLADYAVQEAREYKTQVIDLKDSQT